MHRNTTAQRASISDRYTKLPDTLLYVLKPQEHMLLHALLSHRWFNDSEIYPSVTRLAGILGWSDRTVQRWLRRLEAGGWIITEARHRDESEWGDKGQTSNRYRPGLMLLPLLPLADASPVTGGRRPGLTKPDNGKYTTRTDRTTNVRTSGFLESREGHYHDVIRR